MQTVQKVAREQFLPYALPSIGEEEIAEVVDSLRSGWVTTGPKVKRFEKDFADYIGAKHAITVNSCTAGLHIALTSLGVGPGDEVIVPTMTFCSTANVVVHLGARPVLVDVGEDFNVLPESIERAITHRTKAIVPVHHSGQACDLSAIYAIAERYHIPIVEDAAHAVGTTYNGLKIGSDALVSRAPNVAHATVFSFYATKNMSTGEGGMITTPDNTLMEQMRLFTLHGMSHDAWKRYSSSGSWYYEVIVPGYKDNMTDIAASMGIHQLRRLDGFIKVRQEYGRRYDKGFADWPEIQTPLVHSDRNHTFHLYVIRLCLDRLTINRAQFIEALRAQNIGTSVHFIPVHLHPYYQQTFGYHRGALPRAEALYDQIISLPLYPRMTEADVDYVVEAVRQVISEHRRAGAVGLTKRAFGKDSAQG